MWGSLRARVERADGRVVGIDVSTLTEPDCETVDILARLQLLARRRGREIALRNASPRLCELLELSGLADIVPCVDESSGIESRRETEERKEPLGVEEEDDPADPVT